VGAENGEIWFEVEDDGRGIDPADLAKSRSLGLKGMRERVNYLGGSIEVTRTLLPIRSARKLSENWCTKALVPP